MGLQLRELTMEERVALDRLARSRKAETRLTERVRIIQSAAIGQTINAIAHASECPPRGDGTVGSARMSSRSVGVFATR